jgi:hypothetical protein
LAAGFAFPAINGTYELQAPDLLYKDATYHFDYLSGSGIWYIYIIHTCPPEEEPCSGLAEWTMGGSSGHPEGTYTCTVASGIYSGYLGDTGTVTAL